MVVVDAKEGNLRGEEASQDIAGETSDGVDGENVERIVDSEQELDLGAVVASRCANNAKDYSRPGGNETGARGDGDEASNDAGAESNGRPLLLKPIVQQTPCDSTDRGSQVGHNGGHDGAQVGGKGRAGVKAEPTHP